MTTVHLLSFLIWLPTIAAVILLITFRRDQGEALKRFATLAFGVLFALSLLLLGYDRIGGGMQFIENHEWIPFLGAHYQLGVDGVSILLIILTTGLGLLSALSSWQCIATREKEYYALLLFLQTAIVGTFASLDLFLFFLFFEVTLVPMYFLIGIWGGPNRLYAALKFFLYTIAGSLLMLLGIIKLHFLTQDAQITGQVSETLLNSIAAAGPAQQLLHTALADIQAGHGTFNILYLHAMGSVLPMGSMQVLLFAAFAIGFAIKVPLFPFHTWLPDAHVEAPTAASVILAAVLLKLGTYGFFRFCIPMFPAAALDEKSLGGIGVRSVMVFLALTSIIYGALAAMYFVVKKDGDVKKLVAYSSVSSMGLVLLGLFSLNPNGMYGAVLHMINHGIYSAALFLLVGIIYERRHTRLVSDFGGLGQVMKGYAFVFMIIALTALGLPLLCVFISEFLTIRGAFEANPIWAGVAALGMVLTAGYMLWLYQRMFLGTVDKTENEHLADMSLREWAYMLPLVFASFWIGIYPKPILELIEQPATSMIKHVRASYPLQPAPGPPESKP